MTTEWTAERLDALPDLTVIEIDWPLDHDEEPDIAIAREGCFSGYWQCEVRGEKSSAEVAMARSIRVVSVPIDALLSFPAFIADELSVGTDQYLRDAIPLITDFILNGVIAHVTGEESGEAYCDAVRPAIERWPGGAT